jgi:hypothetical protein
LRSRGVWLAGALAAAALASATPPVRGAPSQAVDAGTPVDPYVDPTQLEPGPSFVRQPWRGWMDTVPLSRLLDGIGVQYRMPAATDHDAALDLLADAGFHRARFEVPWNDMDGTGDDLTPQGRERLERFLRAAASNDVGVLLVLNANSIEPTPHEQRQVRVVETAEAGARQVRLDTVDGLVPLRSGFSELVGRVMAGVLVTDVDEAARSVTLGRPLPRRVEAGELLTLDTLAYAPLDEVGSAAFEHTWEGWARYVQAVLAVAADHDLPDLDVELWNETAFDSEFLDLAHYVDTMELAQRAKFRPGGRAWELARRTVELVHREHPGVGVVWGFSSTDFYATPVEDLPPGTDGASYHPYGTNLVHVPGEFPPADVAPRYDGVPARLTIAVPEGRTATALDVDPLVVRRLAPDVRDRRPPDTETFAHLITEHGCTPSEAGVTDPAAAMHHKARCLLRYLPFWLHKGIAQLYASRSWDLDPLGRGLMDPSGSPAHGDGLDSEALDAIERLVDAVGDAEPIRTPRPLEVEVAALGLQTPVLTLPSGEELFHRDQLAVLPFQASDDRFAVAVYVLTDDVTVAMAPEPFRITLRPVAPDAELRWYDPLTGEDEAIRDAAPAAGGVSLTVDVGDTTRLLLVDESPEPASPIERVGPGVLAVIVTAVVAAVVMVLGSRRGRDGGGRRDRRGGRRRDRRRRVVQEMP